MDKKYMNCTRCELCGTADVIYGSPFMEYSILFRLLTAPLATMGMGLLSATIVKTKGIHINTKVILLVLCISTIVCNTGITVDCLYKFFISNVMPNYMQCDFQVFSPQYGLVIRHIEILGTTYLSTSAIALAIERTVATIFYRNYSSKPTLGSILVVVQILISFIPLWNIRLPKQMYPYSPPELHDYKLYHFISMWQTLVNVLAFFIFMILWIINYYRKKIIGNSHLQVVLARYNLHENMSTTRLMAPIIVVIAMIVFAAELSLLLVTPQYDRNTVVTHQVLDEVIEYSFYPELQLTLIPILFIALILILVIVSKKIRENFLLVSNLSICFPVKVHNTDSRSSSESSSSEGSSERIHWNRKIDGLSITPQTPDF
ncbi:hypothetical protein GCK72_023189 [Caenorhabditis remanei]|uniref:G-protein coupled receptors family 1 profile domain-containing protein n=1 Tax=Caenorhabditis remanei TaxID=31234 RepID=A0A6A5FW37_CAERE|nr:hypothetical protein GCK72_023189 [Caenorhabditis remanei]KAF1746732.1 hypothetical protein GCK72_023189 [Caenorhabditis remanei]